MQLEPSQIITHRNISPYPNIHTHRLRKNKSKRKASTHSCQFTGECRVTPSRNFLQVAFRIPPEHKSSRPSYFFVILITFLWLCTSSDCHCCTAELWLSLPRSIHKTLSYKLEALFFTLQMDQHEELLYKDLILISLYFRYFPLFYFPLAAHLPQNTLGGEG